MVRFAGFVRCECENQQGFSLEPRARVEQVAVAAMWIVNRGLRGELRVVHRA